MLLRHTTRSRDDSVYCVNPGKIPAKRIVGIKNMKRSKLLPVKFGYLSPDQKGAARSITFAAYGSCRAPDRFPVSFLGGSSIPWRSRSSSTPERSFRRQGSDRRRWRPGGRHRRGTGDADQFGIGAATVTRTKSPSVSTTPISLLDNWSQRMSPANPPDGNGICTS